ncbi:MAG: hypothetical protein H6876_06185 [Hyphomicrobiaceae bacterium]|nr:hypothetical protein [Hyphomicrobiaceae bacterium]
MKDDGTPVLNIPLPTDQPKTQELLRYLSFYAPARETKDGQALTLIGKRGITLRDAVWVHPIPFEEFDAFVETWRARALAQFSETTTLPESADAIVEQFPVLLDRAPHNTRPVKNADGTTPLPENFPSPQEKVPTFDFPVTACEVLSMEIDLELGTKTPRPGIVVRRLRR